MWQALLRRKVAAAIERAAVVLIPNDKAYPYDRLLEVAKRKGRPTVLLQEGIRFELPSRRYSRAYGAGGVSRIAAWGDESRKHFQGLGVAPERIRVTGNPRLDSLVAKDWRAPDENLPPLGDKPFVLLLTNPIDDQGYCTREERLSLIRESLERLSTVCRSHGLRVLWKPHPREDLDTAQEAEPFLPEGTERLRGTTALYPLLARSEAVVVLASSAGLEATLLGIPVAALEIPGWGFAHDYVSSGLATPLAAGNDWASPIRDLLDSRGPNGAQNRRTYLEKTVRLGSSAQRVAELCKEAIQ